MLIVALALTVILTASIGGALAGIHLGGKDLGRQIAATAGTCYGLTVAIPSAILLALYLALSRH